MEAIRDRIRDAKRFAAVLKVLIRHGFHSFVQESGLESLLSRGMSLIGRGEADPAVHDQPWTVRLRMMLEELGPTYIKLGQVLSTRPDLIPAELATELKRLQNDCPRVPFDEIHQQLKGEFGDQLEVYFAGIDEEPLAAGSMAQSHRAVLAGGERVVLKVLRPGIEKMLASDMNILMQIATLGQKYLTDLGFSPRAVINAFSRQLRREQDLTHEARATERLNRMFDRNPRINFPYVYREQSTQRVLCLEEITGRLLSDLDPADLPEDTRRAIVVNGADAVFHMCFEARFFHADPHPGNIFAHDDGSITFIDCGMTGNIDQQTADDLARLVRAVLRNDLDTTVRTVIDISQAPHTLEANREFRSDAADYIQNFQMIDNMADARLGVLIEGLFELLRKWRVICPGDLVFLIKALATIEGVGQDIDPTFDLIGHARPLFRRTVMKRYSLRSLRTRALRLAEAYIDIIERLPYELRTLGALFRGERFQINIRHEGIDRLSQTLDRTARTISYSMVLASIILASSILILADPMEDKTGWLAKAGMIGLLVVTLFVMMLVLLNFVQRWRWYRIGRREKNGL